MAVISANHNTTGDAGTLVPRPRTIQETGLSTDFLLELLAKHLYRFGVLDLQQLAEQTALAGAVLDALIGVLRKESRIEVLGATESSAGLRYSLSDKGRVLALDAFLKSGYVGPAPVTLEHYCSVVAAQSVHRCVVTRESMKAAFADAVVQETLLNQLGPAAHSGRAIMVYGQAGTGKTYICQRLARLLGDTVFIPQAIAVGNSVVQFFDPVLHKPVSESEASSLLRLQEGHDPRFVRCHRPVAISGGELTLGMLELQYDAATKLTQAPVQLKANNGIYIVDDLGRQRAAPVELLNRWIVPMEEKLDYLTLETGRRFPVPFDVILVFSTNLNPLQLADEAFLRRLGSKIHFTPLCLDDFKAIWRQVCEQHGIAMDTGLFEFVLELYRAEQKPMLPCHPRDLIGLALDQSRYQGLGKNLNEDCMKIAWMSYFIRIEPDQE